MESVGPTCISLDANVICGALAANPLRTSQPTLLVGTYEWLPGCATNEVVNETGKDRVDNIVGRFA